MNRKVSAVVFLLVAFSLAASFVPGNALSHISLVAMIDGTQPPVPPSGGFLDGTQPPVPPSGGFLDGTQPPVPPSGGKLSAWMPDGTQPPVPPSGGFFDGTQPPVPPKALGAAV
jgi:hypothetical protein